ncbi:hypothetical protein GCM10009738_19450 [Kitasatospora viridis]|uniref:Ricin-type beta-trefoil lectin protein n=1 Tax=Kitasatospora viridis TaxID=281105 RepID=A0A561UNF7_9ACTN|nr:ricin-type beta-trefoil lectin protein [Kitasatospora viridis]
MDALTTATSSTSVNPNGTLTTTDYTAPVRVRQGSTWAAIDTTLRSNNDGTLSPAVAPTALKLSGGGAGPLATVTTASGQQLSVTAPFPLPAPSVSGATATYSGVLTSDVDLQVTALPDGGWRDVIVVKTAAAAANPALESLNFPIAASGLTASSDASGNVTFKDGFGTVWLHAPTPMEWDSSTPPPAASGTTSTRTGLSQAAPTAAGDASGAATSTPDGPGDSANVAPIAVSTAGNDLSLTPDQSVLGKGTGPWFIDPSISADSGTQHWVQVQENHPDTKNYDVQSPVGTGYCGYSDCTGYGRYRGYFQIGINPNIYNQPSGAPSPPTVYNSTFYAQVSDASSPSSQTPFGLYWTPPIDGNTTWNNQPCGTNGTMAGCSKIGPSFPLTGTGPISFDVTAQMQQAAQQHWANWTVGIAPDDENNKYYRHHISISPGSAPHITTNYDIQPSTWGASTTPQPGFASTNTYFPCNSHNGNPWDNVGWIGANQNVQLAVDSWSPAGLNLHTAFNMFWNSGGTQGNLNLDSGWGGSYNVGAGAQSVTVPVSQLTDGQVYGWHAGSYDADPAGNGLGAPWSELCYFGVDRTPPTVSISSTDFPMSGTPNPSPAKWAGDTGAFTLHGFDPAPSGGSASGVACYRVSTQPSPATGWKCTDGTSNGVYPNNTATNTVNFPFQAGNWGTNILYAQAQDNAGNYSQPTAYAFYAPWNPKSPTVFGDITGGKKPNIVLPDSSGNLKVVNTAEDPANAIAAGASMAPVTDGSGWTNVQISHRGSLKSGIYTDDLIAHAAGGVDVYLYVNDGSGNLFTKTTLGTIPMNCQDATGAPLPNGCPGGYTDANDTWANASQVVALGTPEGEVNTSPGATRTSLIAVVNKQLWLFHSGKTLIQKLDGTARLLSSADWSNYDLINPGPANGTNQPTLWARNRTDGTIHAYPITGGATPNYSALADPTGGTVLSGINLPVASYPRVGSSGDLNGDGVADLWAANPSGQVTIWSGTSQDNTAGTPVNGFKNPTSPTSMPAALGVWTLTGTANTDQTRTPDAFNQVAGTPLGAHPGSLNGVTFTPDTPTTNVANVASFDGSTSRIDTNGPVVDTTKSFTVDAWAKPNSNGGVVLAQDGSSTSGFMLWPDNGTWRFAMATADTSGWPYDTTNLTNNNAAVQLGSWTHLTASYNATTRQMSLFVNGSLAGTGTHQNPIPFNGNFGIGRWLNNGRTSNYFNGRISGVAAYTGVITPGTVPGAIAVSSASTKCVDLNQDNTTPGNIVQVWDCNGTPSQQWSFQPDGTVNVGGGCLDATGAGTADGTLIEYWTCVSGALNQQWIPRADGSIYNPASGRCLDDPAGNLVDGTRLELWDCVPGAANQRWTITATA